MRVSEDITASSHQAQMSAYNAYILYTCDDVGHTKTVVVVSSDPTRKSGSVAQTGGAARSQPGISDVDLDGEDNDSVEVYDTCNEIRKKIAAYTTKAGVTQAQFCRDLHAQLHSAGEPKSIQSSQLDKFRSNKGPKAGCSSSVFYAAYVFFEKLRIAEGKPKSKHKLNMEQQWPGGMYLDARRNRAWCVAGTRPYVGQYGIMTVR